MLIDAPPPDLPPPPPPPDFEDLLASPEFQAQMSAMMAQIQAQLAALVEALNAAAAQFALLNPAKPPEGGPIGPPIDLPPVPIDPSVLLPPGPPQLAWPTDLEPRVPEDLLPKEIVAQARGVMALGMPKGSEIEDLLAGLPQAPCADPIQLVRAFAPLSAAVTAAPSALPEIGGVSEDSVRHGHGGEASAF